MDPVAVASLEPSRPGSEAPPIMNEPPWILCSGEYMVRESYRSRNIPHQRGNGASDFEVRRNVEDHGQTVLGHLRIIDIRLGAYEGQCRGVLGTISARKDKLTDITKINRDSRQLPRGRYSGRPPPGSRCIPHRKPQSANRITDTQGCAEGSGDRGYGSAFTRTQQVNNRDVAKETLEVDWGEPQGTILTGER